MEILARHGFITLTEDGNMTSSATASTNSVGTMGTPWQVNEALLSVVYVSAKDWHGWDKITITVTDLGYDGLQPIAGPTTYNLHLSVAAINDAPILEVFGFTAVNVSNQESPSSGEETSAFLVSTPEDTARTISGVVISDVDTAATGTYLGRPDGFFGTGRTDSKGDGVGMLAFQPKLELKLSCTYGLLALGGEHAGLVAEEGELGARGKTLTVVGTLSSLNAAMAEGIVYTPEENWGGIDVVEVSSCLIVGKHPGSLFIGVQATNTLLVACHVSFFRAPRR